MGLRTQLLCASQTVCVPCAAVGVQLRQLLGQAFDRVSVVDRLGTAESLNVVFADLRERQRRRDRNEIAEFGGFRGSRSGLRNYTLQDFEEFQQGFLFSYSL